MRGDLVSRPIGEVLREAEALARAGVRELLVISQDTSAYGVDIKYRTGFVQGRPVRTRLTELVKELAKLGLWVRLHYVYPYPHVDELFELMAQGLVLPYLDVPFQHANRRILKLMKRPASAEDVLRRIESWRRQCPDLTIRSTFIAGFPSESEAEFQELLEFLDAAQIDRAGCFAYSPVEGASANQIPGALPDDVREERRDRLMLHQAEISRERLKRWKGRRLQILIDTLQLDEDGELLGAVGRSASDAPEIDGVVYLRPHQSLKVGQFVTARITRSDHYDLYGSVVKSSR